jgi:hypothetical protein
MTFGTLSQVHGQAFRIIRIMTWQPLIEGTPPIRHLGGGSSEQVFGLEPSEPSPVPSVFSLRWLRTEWTYELWKREFWTRKWTNDTMFIYISMYVLKSLHYPNSQFWPFPIRFLIISLLTYINKIFAITKTGLLKWYVQIYWIVWHSTKANAIYKLVNLCKGKKDQEK